MAASSADDDFVADINVTPFVDVMLVLLIIFMVTAPMMTEGLDVALPKVETSEVLPTDDDHIILTIKSNGALYLDEYETGMADLPEVLATRVKNAGRQLFVRADKDVPYGTVMAIMGRIKAEGVTVLPGQFREHGSAPQARPQAVGQGAYIGAGTACDPKAHKRQACFKHVRL